MAACNFPCKAPTWSEDCSQFNATCRAALNLISPETGPFNIYNYYDNCGSGNQHMTWQAHLAAGAQPNPTQAPPIRRTFTAVPPSQGGMAYACGTGPAAEAWANNPAVRAALHMRPESFYQRRWSSSAASSAMQYTTYTGASFDLYPRILQHVRTTIYNGDVDACVPYNSNEDWIVTLARMQHYPEVEAWRPWLHDEVPAGYVTTYSIPGAAANMTFVTVKDSGHMVPQYQPERAFAFFQRWIGGGHY